MAVTHCPHCGSNNIRLSSYGQDIGGILGGALGATAGVMGTAGGGLIGKKLGEKLDKHVVRKYRCKSCGKSIWD